MIFQNDKLIFLVLLAPVIGWWLWRFFEKRMESRRRFAEDKLWNLIAPREHRWVPITRIMLMSLAFACLFVAVARPKGGQIQEETSSTGIEIFFLMDLSKSMMVEDVGASRILIQKKVAEAIIKSNPNDKVGIIGFTGEPYVICPLTLDHATLLTFLENVDVDENSIHPGTGYGDAIELAIRRFQGTEGRAIVLFSDGENNKGVRPEKAARDALREAVKIFSIGIGTETGTRLFERDFFQRPVPRTYRGEPVIVKLDKASLKEVASITNGKSYFIESVRGAQDVFVDFDRSAKAIFKSGLSTHKKELAGYFIFVAALLMIGDSLVSTFRLIPRKRPDIPSFVSNNNARRKKEKTSKVTAESTK